METSDDMLDQLIAGANAAADRDAGRVALGLEGRLMQRLQDQGGRSDLALQQWAAGFWRAAIISAVVVAALGTWALWSVDYAEFSEDLALSGLTGEQPVELWPRTL